MALYVIIITPMAHDISVENSALKSALHQVGFALHKFSIVCTSVVERTTFVMIITNVVLSTTEVQTMLNLCNANPT